MLNQCSELCGWTVGVIGALCLGSFGVPIKLISKADVDPLVLQSYKSIVCFLTCWLIIPLGEPFKFTPLGLVSGLFWVPGATAGIYGIRNAGLAISVGTWSSIMVMTSFCWGIFVFHEKVKTVSGAIGSALVLIIGLIGMSVYSSPTTTITTDKDGTRSDEMLFHLLSSQGGSNSMDKEGLEDIVDVSASNTSVEMTTTTKTSTSSSTTATTTNTLEVENNFNTVPKLSKITRRKKMDDNIVIQPCTIHSTHDRPEQKEDEQYMFLGGKIRLSRRQLGIVGAIINGVWGGNNMIPLHYARKQGFVGGGYLISYSCGSMIVTILIWLLRYVYNLYLVDFDSVKAYNALPSFHLREMWLAGFISGTLYSIGNFCSILAVTSLGQGVGYSLVQTSMLASGIW
eukprot:CAMPEP_0176487788 /NCGR_PEP_ID=MMETSP0200_2-20121128/6337_1 /TAXON_ID=947934 /ORGANISM="Chaetoceros sp., Strain GSL56" /LENGTH=398 /DNA_ID=CAMNT_0017884677 /DNA_START=110 /DNA_END=1303 /DNA_ORIENTATION=-